MAYDEIDPFGERRADIRAAQIVKALWEIKALDVKKTKRPTFQLKDFILQWEQDVEARPGKRPRPRNRQTVEQQRNILKIWQMIMARDQNDLQVAEGKIPVGTKPPDLTTTKRVS